MRILLLVLLAVCLGGCSQVRERETLLLDHAGGTTGRAHCTAVDDPFGGAGKVILGEAVEGGHNKTSFFNDNGFFTVPPAWDGSVVIRLAVTKARQLRIALVSETGKLKTYYVDAPALDGWCDVVLPLSHISERIKPGEKIVDISIWQTGGAEGGALYVDRAFLRTPRR